MELSEISRIMLKKETMFLCGSKSKKKKIPDKGLRTNSEWSFFKSKNNTSLHFFSLKDYIIYSSFIYNKYIIVYEVGIQKCP